MGAFSFYSTSRTSREPETFENYMYRAGVVKSSISTQVAWFLLLATFCWGGKCIMYRYGRITMGGCLFFSRWKSSAQPKKLEQEHSHHIEKRPLFNLFMNFYRVLRNTFKAQNGDQTICHCFLKEFIFDIITILQKFEFPQLVVLASCIFVLVFLWLQRHSGHVARKGNRST